MLVVAGNLLKMLAANEFTIAFYVAFVQLHWKTNLGIFVLFSITDI